MGDKLPPKTDSSHTARIEQVLSILQERVQYQETILGEFHNSVNSIETEPSPDLKVNLRQLRLLTAAYQSINSSKPYLPPCDSLLPPLLAFFITSKTIRETQISITETEASLEKIKKRIEKEQSDLAKSKLIQIKLRARISDLEDDVENQARKSLTEINRDQKKKLKTKKAYYDNETRELLSVLHKFVDIDIAPMLVIEELGGPIVSQAMDIDDEMLENQFSHRGKTKKAKIQGDVRQKRIDQIWGRRATDSKEYSEKRAAALEMKMLIEQLLNNITIAGECGAGSYIKLQRDSAAARFLVRANVAQLHPRDASKLRIIDFASNFDN